MKVLIFFETIISFDIVWNLALRLDQDMLRYALSAVTLHYINLVIKLIILKLEIHKWYWWVGIVLSESLSFGLLSVLWENKVDLTEVLIVIQCGWTFNREVYHSSGVILMIYYIGLEYFKQSSSIFYLIKTTIILILFLWVSYKIKPVPIAKKQILSDIKDQERDEETPRQASFDQNSILEIVPWLSEQKFIVFNEKMLVIYEQAQLLTFIDGSIDENSNQSQSVLISHFLDCKCESVSTNLLQLLLGPQPKRKAFFKPDIKQLCLTILEANNSRKCYFSAGEIENKLFRLSNYKINIIVYDGISNADKLLIVHLEQILDKKSQFSKSLHTISVHQNISNNSHSKQTEINNTISSYLLSNMFQSVSHEFGTYLNCIMSVSEEALKNTLISKDIKEIYFEPIQINSQLLYYILRNIRDYNSILLNQFVLRLQEFSPKEKINEIIILMDKQLEFHQNKVEVNCPNDLIVCNDAERYKQIIYQLLSNAIKFTQDGTIKIDITVNKDNVKTTVSDPGIGMDSTEITKLNEMLNDSKKMLKISKNSVGCGLGLSISNVISQKMSGRKGIHFTSVQNKGSTFIFNMTNSHQLYNDSLYQTSQTYVKVLNETYYLEYPPSEGSIKQMGFSSKYEHSHKSQNSKGQIENRQQLKGFSNRKQSGETQQQFLHRLSEFSKMHTVNPSIDKHDDLEYDENENENGSEPSYGYQPLIVIPSLSTNFKTQILQYNISSKCCPRVLIADDEIFNITSLQLILSKFSIKTEKVFNGAEAIKKCEEKKLKPCKRCLCAGFTAIFLDLNMPVMDGFDAVRIIKQKMADGLIPKALCIANTGYADLETKRQALAAGIDFYLTKPFDIKVLEEYLKAKFPLSL